MKEELCFLGLHPEPILTDRTATNAPACATPISYLQRSAGLEVAVARGVAGVVADGLGARARAEVNALTDSPYWKATLSQRRKYGQS
jgi:hypothetical protein